MSYPEILYYTTFATVMICWIVFAAAFFFRKSPKTPEEKKRNNKAFIGILLEAVGYSLVWMLRRKDPFIIEEGGVVVATAISAIAVLLAVGSGWLVNSAVRTLGKQWAVAARVVEDHQLVTSGPYAIVRNPIYSCMFGMLIATGLAVSIWYALPVAIIIFWYGTHIRVKIEEALLRETFGPKFEEYAESVPRLIPKLF